MCDLSAGHFEKKQIRNLLADTGLQKEVCKSASSAAVACSHMETVTRNLQLRTDNGVRHRCKWLKSIDTDNSYLLQQRTVRVSEQRLFLYQARHHVPAPQTQTKYPNTRPVIQGKRYAPTLHRAWHANAAIIQSQASF